MTAEHLLTINNLSKTTGRRNILNILLSSTSALSEREIQYKLQGICDRATIYRALKLFLNAGIIHPIVSEGIVTRYIIKKDPEEHLHFKCTACHKIICLPDIQIHEYALPEGYRKTEASLLISGICKNCNNK